MTSTPEQDSPQPQPYSNQRFPSAERTMRTLKSKAEPYDNVFKGGFGPYAPPRDLPFPDDANLTAYELLAFLPHCLQSAHVVYRFISNGGTRSVLSVLITVARDMPKEWHANRCGTIMYKAMKDAGFEGWTVKVHDRWHASKKAQWNETILNVTGFRTPAQVRGIEIVEDDIPFKSLAAGVRRMPQGDDALDLTRMVQHCVLHQEEEWMYPRDYAKLCKLLGGPAQVRLEHIDRMAFKRWENTVPPPPRLWSEGEKEAAMKAMETKPKRYRASSARMRTPAPEVQSREATPKAETQRRRSGRPRKRVRLEEIDVEEGEEILDVEEEVPHIELYTRAPAVYVAPPADARAPSAAAVNLAFAAEHDVGEIDPFSAYAFGGPRHSPPFRMLHEIQQPHSADISGWAENLRWTLEQRACFWHAVQTEGWNESPAHMELIAQIRQKQVWASDELLELLPDMEDEEPDFVVMEKAEEEVA